MMSITEKKQRESERASLCLFLNIDRPETQFDPSMDMYADCVYEKQKKCWTERLQRVFLFRMNRNVIICMN